MAAILRSLESVSKADQRRCRNTYESRLTLNAILYTLKLRHHRLSSSPNILHLARGRRRTIQIKTSSVVSVKLFIIYIDAIHDTAFISFGDFSDAGPALLTRSRQMTRNRNLRLHVAQFQRQVATRIVRSGASPKLPPEQSPRAAKFAALFNMY
jgi:hypothetical protein